MLRLIIIPLFFTAFASVSQPSYQLPMEDGKVTFSRVIQLDDSFTASDIYSLVKEFIATNNNAFNRQNADSNYSGRAALGGVEKKPSGAVDQLFKNDNPLKVENSPERLSAKGVFKYSGRDVLVSSLRLMYIEYMVNVYIKDGRYKVEVTDLLYTHYDDRSMKTMQIGSFRDEGPCSSKGKMETLLLCDKAKKSFDVFYPSLSSEMTTFINELAAYVSNGKSRSKKMDF